MAALTHVLSIFVQLIFLEGILSIDNAAVLGALASVLPKDRPVPFPRPLRFLRDVTDQFLGHQQAAALKVGLLAAYAGRGLMLFLADWIRHYPFLQMLGAAYLVKLALQNLKPARIERGSEGAARKSQSDAGFWLVVLHIELADLTLSLDNVVAAVALSPHLWVVMLGVALGILAMRFAAGAFTWLVQREPILEMAAYLVIFNLGVELIAQACCQVEVASWQKFAISAGTLLLCVAYARLPFLHILAPFFHRVGAGIGLVDSAVNDMLSPLTFPLKHIVRLINRIT